MFISFEGLDGTGKTTQINLLKEGLRHMGDRVLYLREPGGTDIGNEIRKVLLADTSGMDHDIHPHSELLLMMASRVQLVEHVIRPHLDAGGLVICDRFMDSTHAYQGGGRDMAHLTYAMQKMFLRELLPDLTFYLDIDVDTMFDRLRGRGGMDRFENEDIEFYERSRQQYQELIKNDTRGRFRVIDGTLSVIDVHNKVLKELMDLLK